MRRALFTRLFWLDALERAIKSFAQGAIGAIGQDAIGVDWYQARLWTVVGSGLTMAVLSVLTSVMSAGVSSSMSPASAVPTVAHDESQEAQP